jgi:hypothetical protein
MAFREEMTHGGYCNRCKKVHSVWDGDFCSKCGTKLISTPKCECGIYINPSHNYCCNCGKKNEKSV